MFAVNPHISPQYKTIGANKTPVVIIDDYFENFERLSELAKQEGQFEPDNFTSYPGLRSKLPKPLVVDYLQPLMKGLYGIFNIPQHYRPLPKDNYFSLLTHQPEQLSSLQTIPHFDTPSSHLIAVIHYIGQGAHGGLGFYQHKPSGLEKIDHSSKDYFYQNTQRYFQQNNQTKSYCEKEHPLFHCYEEIAYKPNRLVIFPGQLLHSSLVDVTTDISTDPLHGRLTANMFIQFSEEK
ncbi:DUF6445 family protein [Thalassotalea sp. PLHSN55]|uniref:DUF6445 family protein n=1 Tax=Thalassotalea sp. PLHSN55 TaxID=3435888 RepID=UPI003F82C6EA